MSRLDPTGRPIPPKLPGTLADAAVAYAQAGIPIFPCVPGEKNPLIKRGFHRATTDLRQVRRWWRRTPEANIGIATGRGVEVLDVDVHAIGTGFPLLRTLHRSGQISGWAQAVRSPAGGIHLYYPTDPAREQRSWARGTAHLDFRGLGGYIIAPPSIVTTDHGPRRYELIATGRSPRPIDADAIREFLTPSPAPASTTAAPARGGAGAERLVAWVARLPEGNRNAGLFWAACRLVEAGLTEAETHAVLEPAALATALDAREIAATIRSAHRTASIAPDPAESRTGASSDLTGMGR
ncbi:bifunctional DNA primase/polymerase [Leucobacter chromiiresistens]|uniref:Primase C terminal 1 (PriCT-1) n=1 Tax=Leucobacter chromiiresistens TaxID=1079994 RepID=A0A1H0Z3R6_9MICO|nr:bifunctional DNA primase/polymerase [Leucobacter chromiiresistens]SDQ21771.1 Primase C terminal 1 (PriCT-1) [Leucobacter chromiiresistens]